MVLLVWVGGIWWWVVGGFVGGGWGGVCSRVIVCFLTGVVC